MEGYLVSDFLEAKMSRLQKINEVLKGECKRDDLTALLKEKAKILDELRGYIDPQTCRRILPIP